MIWRGGLLLMLGALGTAALLFAAASATDSAQAELRDEIEMTSNENAMLVDRLAFYQGERATLQLDPDLFVIAETRASAERHLQQTIVDVARGAGLSLVNFGPAPPPEETATPAIGFELEAEASYEQVLGFLERLETSRPRIAMHFVQIRPRSDASERHRKLHIRLHLVLWTFWRGEEQRG